MSYLYAPLLVCLPLLAHAQNPPTRHATLVDVAGAAGPTLHYAAVAGWHVWGLDAGGRFQVGAGVRASYFFAQNADFDAQNAEAGGYALRVPDARLASFNAALHLRARVLRPLHLGFTIDLAGVSAGAARTGQLVASNGASLGSAPAKPVRGNILLGGLSDRGSLNSELYASLALPARLSLRVGYSHVVTAYQTDDYPGGGGAEAARFRRFRNLATLGISYQLGGRAGF